MPTIKHIPENKPRCLLSVTSLVGSTDFIGFDSTIDATGDWTWRRWIESVSAWDGDNIGMTWLF